MWLGQWSRVSTPAGQVVVARLVVPVEMGREGGKGSVVAAGSGRTVTTGWTWEGGQSRNRQRRPRRRLVAVAAVLRLCMRSLAAPEEAAEVAVSLGTLLAALKAAAVLRMCMRSRAAPEAAAEVAAS